MTNPEYVDVKDIKNGDGIILEKGFHKALFLPQVWKEIPEKKTFLENLSMKAGLDTNGWKDAKFYKFAVKIYKGQ